MAVVQLSSSTSRRQSHQQRREKWASLRPDSVLLYVENRCHLKCAHCYESDASHPARQHLSLEDYGLLFDELVQMGVFELVITGGEVFLRKDIFELLQLAREKRFSVRLLTSGTLIDEERADKLAALNLTAIDISVYSHKAEIHDTFTGVKGSHARSVNALKMLSARGVRTLLKSNITTFNIDALDELIELAESLGTRCSLDPMVVPRLDGDTDPTQYAVSPGQLASLVLTRPDLAPTFRNYTPESLCSGEKSILQSGQSMCGAARNALAIGADGSLFACGFFSEAGAKWQPGQLEDLWLTSDQFDSIRETTFGQMTSCGSCDNKSVCSPCMAHALVETGDHRGCNIGSRTLSTAMLDMTRAKATANTKMASGRTLAVFPQSLNFVRPTTLSAMLDSEP